MKSLKWLLLEALRELAVSPSGAAAIGPPATAIQEQQEIIEFPAEGFAVSIFAPEKKLVFTPIQGVQNPKKMATFGTMLKQQFHVSRINSFGDQENERSIADDYLQKSFEVIFDPRENFDSVLQFLRDQSGSPGGEQGVAEV